MKAKTRLPGPPCFLLLLLVAHAAASLATVVSPEVDCKTISFDKDTIDRINAEYELLNMRHVDELNRLAQEGIDPFSSARLPNNFNKNRYSDILAMESTRVKLAGYRDLGLDSDYINANYIGETPRSNRYFIASQAPLPSTLSHFWLMVWENKSPIIIMLTDLDERGQVKASAYWPEEVGSNKQFGPFQVTLVGSEMINMHIKQRTLDLEYKGETRRIMHLQHTKWPDFGTPKSTKTIRYLSSLLQLYKATSSELGGPVVVHCSAGVGRAGTFIAIHIGMEKLQFDNSIKNVIKNIPLSVAAIRRSRTGMVQTADQYRFIYEALRDACGEFTEFPHGVVHFTSSFLHNSAADFF